MDRKQALPHLFVVRIHVTRISRIYPFNLCGPFLLAVPILKANWTKLRTSTSISSCTTILTSSLLEKGSLLLVVKFRHPLLLLLPFSSPTPHPPSLQMLTPPATVIWLLRFDKGGGKKQDLFLSSLFLPTLPPESESFGACWIWNKKKMEKHWDAKNKSFSFSGEEEKNSPFSHLWSKIATSCCCSSSRGQSLSFLFYIKPTGFFTSRWISNSVLIFLNSVVELLLGLGITISNSAQCEWFLNRVCSCFLVRDPLSTWAEGWEGLEGVRKSPFFHRKGKGDCHSKGWREGGGEWCHLPLPLSSSLSLSRFINLPTSHGRRRKLRHQERSFAKKILKKNHLSLLLCCF